MNSQHKMKQTEVESVWVDALASSCMLIEEQRRKYVSELEAVKTEWFKALAASCVMFNTVMEENTRLKKELDCLRVNNDEK